MVVELNESVKWRLALVVQRRAGLNVAHYDLDVVCSSRVHGLEAW
jgi:hypothetical protein